MSAPRVVVYGGHGFFGRLVVEDILQHTDATVVVVGRRPKMSPSLKAFGERIQMLAADLDDAARIRRTLSGACVVVHCAGPFQRRSTRLLQEAIDAGVHYIDIADDRDFVRRVHQCHEAARKANLVVLSGLSVVPGLTAQLTSYVQSSFDQIDSVRTFVAPGTQGSRGRGTFVSLLSGAGRPFSVPRDHGAAEVFGGTEPEWIRFPPPVGDRLTYLAIEVADFDLMPAYFGARRVEFKAGSEFAWFNRALAGMSRLRRRTGFPAWERFAREIAVLTRALGSFGTTAGAALVEVTGLKENTAVQQQVAILDEQRGYRIPAVPAAIGVARLIAGAIADTGVVALHKWLPSGEFERELARRDIKLWQCAPPSAWRLFVGGPQTTLSSAASRCILGCRHETI